MSSILGNAYVRIRPDTAGFESDVENKVGGAFRKVAAIAATALAAAGVGGFLKDTIKLSANAEQSIGGVQAVFKNYADTVINRSKSADQALGLSANEYRTLATVIGSQLKNAGVSIGDLGGKTDSLISMGADLAAMFGGTTTEAVEALSAALKGEYDPIERYGISLNEAAIKAEAMSLGLDTSGSSLSTQTRAMAVMSLVNKQGADAMGAFSRENDTAAGRAQRAAAQWENLKTKIGDQLLPAFSATMDVINTRVLPGLENMGGRIKDWVVPAVQGLFDLVAKGDFTKALHDAFNVSEDSPIVDFVLDARERIMHIWDGLGNIWASLDLAGLGQRVLDAAKGAAGDLISGFVQGVQTGDWSAFGAAIVGAIGTALDTIVSLADKLFEALGKLISAVDWGTLAMEFGKQVPTLLLGLVTGILNFDFTSLWNFVVENWFELLMAAVGIFFMPAKLVGKIGELLAKVPLVGEFLKWGWEAIKGFIDNIGTWMGDVVKAFWNGLTGGKSVIPGAIREWFELAKIQIFVWGDDILGWFRALPSNITNAMGDLGAWVGGKFSAMGAAVKGLLEELGAWIGGKFVGIRDTMSNLVGEAWAWVSARFTGMRDAATSIVQDLWNWVRDRFTGMRDNVTQLAQDLWNWVRDRFTGMRDTATSLVQDLWNWVRDRFTGMRDTVTQLAQDLWNWVRDRFTGMRDTATQLAQDLWNWVRDRFTGMRDTATQLAQDLWNWVRDRFTGMRDTATGLAQDLWNWVRDRFTGMRDTATGLVQDLWNWVRDRFTGMRDNVVGIAQNIWDWVTDKFTRMKDGTIDLFARLAAGVGQKWEELKGIAARPINFVIDTVLNNGLFGAFNKVIDTLGLDKGWKLSVPRIPGYAEGGLLSGPGTGTSDSILGVDHRGMATARVSNGEFVVNKKSTDKHLGLLHAINAGKLPAYATGGLVELGRRLQSMGARVSEHPAFGGVAMGGHGKSSLHYTGHAIDVNTRPGESALEQRELAPMEKLARSLGFRTIFMSPGHYNHLHVDDGGGKSILGSLIDGAKSLLGGIWDSVSSVGSSITDSIGGPLKDLRGKFPDSTLLKVAGAVPGNLAGKMWDKIKSKVQSLWDSAQDFLDGGDKPGAGVERWRDTVLQALRIVGQPASLADTTLRRMNQESGGNPNAINNWDINALRGTPSRGLMQTIPSTFAAYRDPSLPNNIVDPLANIVASMRYALKKYGSLPAAYNRKGGYAQGGLVKSGVFDTGGLLYDGQAALNLSGKPERVLNPDQTRKFDAVMSRTGDGDGALVNQLTINVGQDANVRDGMEEAMFQLRRIRRGAGGRR